MARWPSSPTARSCGCLHRASNAASCQQNRRGGEVARADGEHKLRRAEAGAPLGGHDVWACAGADGARARVHLLHVHRSRAQQQGRPKAARTAGEAASRAGHTCGWWVVVPGLEEVDDEVDCGVDRLARALVPRRVHGDVCAWVFVRAEWSVWRGCCVLISRGGWEKTAGLGRRSHLELKRGSHLEQNGVGLMSVERRRQGDDEWKCDEQKAQHDLEALGFGFL